MDYEKKYKEALERARTTLTNELAADIFPELTESEDERIRKAIIGHFKTGTEYVSFSGFSKGKIIAWLEKQGKQKPADLKTKAGNWYMCDMEVMNENMVTAFHRDEIYYCPKDGYLDVRGALFEVGCLDVFRLATEKEIPQTKQEWSEEEIENCAREAEDNSCIILAKHIRQLKSLRPQNTWKPSELQIEALAIAIRCGIKLGTWEEEALKDLIEQLKKLREE